MRRAPEQASHAPPRHPHANTGAGLRATDMTVRKRLSVYSALDTPSYLILPTAQGGGLSLPLRDTASGSQAPFPRS